MERGGRLDQILDKTNDLKYNSVRLEKRSTEVKNVMWWKNKKFIFVILIVVLVGPCLPEPLHLDFTHPYYCHGLWRPNNAFVQTN